MATGPRGRRAAARRPVGLGRRLAWEQSPAPGADPSSRRTTAFAPRSRQERVEPPSAGSSTSCPGRSRGRASRSGLLSRILRPWRRPFGARTASANWTASGSSSSAIEDPIGSATTSARRSTWRPGRRPAAAGSARSRSVRSPPIVSGSPSPRRPARRRRSRLRLRPSEGGPRSGRRARPIRPRALRRRRPGPDRRAR